MKRFRIQPGFSLIEVLIAMAIIAIISSFAIPNYSGYVRRARISEVAGQLAAYRVALEQFYQDNRAYGGDTCGVAAPTATKEFSFSCAVIASGQGFTATATGNPATSGAGFTFAVNHNGDRTTSALPEGWGTVPRACWVLRQQATC